MEKAQKIKFLISFAFAAIFFIDLPAVASAATLYFSPSSGSHAVGTTFSVGVYISSADQMLNAASGVISFPQDKLEVISLSKSSSIFNLWVQEPLFSNSVGTINFEGIVLNPGFTGATGKIITVNFKAKAAGQAGLNFSSGSILANDGQGTNILASLGSAKFSLGVATPPIPEAKPVLLRPAASSTTHPDQSKWYSLNDVELYWIKTVTNLGYSLKLDNNPQTDPGPAVDTTSPSYRFADVDDGIWYFHVKTKYQEGWGPITHFRIQIDTTPPESFTIKFIDGKETDNPQPTVLFDTTDSLSGIDYYKVKIGEGDFITLPSETIKRQPYTLSLQAPGKRNILVQAFDKAGNYAVATEEFVIKPLKEPKFTEYPKELESGEILTVKGESQYPNSQIIVWLQRENDNPKSFTVESDQDGKFIFVADERPGDGIYKLWAEVVDTRGARSLPTEKITIAVARPAIFCIGTWAVSFFAMVVPIVALIIVLLFIILYGWRKFSLLRKRLRKEVREAGSALHKAFDLLKDDIREQIKMLEKTRTKRQLTKEEEKIVKQLKRDLDDAEKFIRKEIEDIEKEVK